MNIAWRAAPRRVTDSQALAGEFADHRPVWISSNARRASSGTPVSG
jgi:hypothetical protein